MTTDTQPPPAATSTERARARRERMATGGWRLVQAELSPTANAALVGMVTATGHTRSAIIEQAIAELYDRLSRA